MHSWIYKLATALVLTLITGSSMAMAQITIDTTGGAQVFGVQGNKVGSWTNSMFTVDTPATLNNSTTFNNDVVFKNNMVVLAVAQAGTSCGTVGAIAQNGNGLVLSCQGSQNSNIWKVAQSNSGGTYIVQSAETQNDVIGSSNNLLFGSTLRVNPYTSCLVSNPFPVHTSQPTPSPVYGCGCPSGYQAYPVAASCAGKGRVSPCSNLLTTYECR